MIYFKATTLLVATAALLCAASSVSSDDSDFMKNAAKGGMAEVELGKMAAMKASDPQVKAFASRMVRDHSKANEKLTQLAASKGVSLPGAKGMMNDASAMHLKMLSDKEFDSAYVKMMVDDHKDDVAAFEKEASSTQDLDIKTFASKTLPTLQAHKAMIDKIQAAMGDK